MIKVNEADLRRALRRLAVIRETEQEEEMANGAVALAEACEPFGTVEGFVKAVGHTVIATKLPADEAKAFVETVAWELIKHFDLTGPMPAALTIVDGIDALEAGLRLQTIRKAIDHHGFAEGMPYEEALWMIAMRDAAFYDDVPRAWKGAVVNKLVGLLEGFVEGE